ncbi:MAG: flippase-like domain-containing protein [Chitinophagaceae bacterium]|nr:flippase-like domain-containing protein [Chitinophagaceae bacterium]
MEISSQKDLPLYINRLYNDINEYTFFMLILVLLFMFIQWMIEAKKWQLLLNGTISLPFFKALKMIFIGISFSIATPNRIGEFVGRIFHLPPEARLQGTGFTFIGNFAQLIATCIAGAIGINLIEVGTLFNQYTTFHIPLFLLQIVSPFLALFLLFVYFKADVFFSWVAHLRFMKRWKDQFIQLSILPVQVLLNVLFLSLMRYGVFLLQYWLMFEVVDLSLDFPQMCISISVLLFMLSIVPTISLVELGLRWQLSILLFAPLTSNVTALTMGVTLIWLFNMVLPAGIGAIAMLTNKGQKN